MKIIFKILLIAIYIATAPVLLLAQAPPHPNGGAAPGGSNGPVGGGAPIGGGVYILIAMALAYGVSRWYAIHTQKMAEE
jgi:hypothetical protein